MSKATNSQISLATGLTPRQIREIASHGTINRGSLRKSIDSLKRIQLTLREASAIWGLSPTSKMLGKHFRNGKLAVCNPAGKPHRVTVKAMIDLMRTINRPESGFRG